jgi:hypothetical protein
MPLHLGGSIGSSVDQVFIMVDRTLGHRIKRVPDAPEARASCLNFCAARSGLSSREHKRQGEKR